jgi:hypothetical protein
MTEVLLDLLKRLPNLLRMGCGLSHVRFVSCMPVRVVLLQEGTVNGANFIPRSFRTQAQEGIGSQ